MEPELYILICEQRIWSNHGPSRTRKWTFNFLANWITINFSRKATVHTHRLKLISSQYFYIIP